MSEVSLLPVAERYAYRAEEEEEEEDTPRERACTRTSGACCRNERDNNIQPSTRLCCSQGNCVTGCAMLSKHPAKGALVLPYFVVNSSSAEDTAIPLNQIKTSWPHHCAWRNLRGAGDAQTRSRRRGAGSVRRREIRRLGFRHVRRPQSATSPFAGPVPSRLSHSLRAPVPPQARLRSWQGCCVCKECHLGNARTLVAQQGPHLAWQALKMPRGAQEGRDGECEEEEVRPTWLHQATLVWGGRKQETGDVL